MSNVEISFCNKAYADKWFEDLCSSNPDQHSVIKALIDEIERNDGGEVSQLALFERYPDVAQYVQGNRFRITPSSGQLLVANGKGIRHAKYSPSKSVALVWQNIKGTIYVTFDDHAPVPYHRAIRHLREISLGRSPLPKPARTRRGLMVMIEALRERGYSRKARRLDLYRRFYR